ncbi:uncharacterized protein BDV14DRAFT_42478 [Aspergillus stella-maris]|uniref:uncharacterized protein n=1 Tax=Aspergillus stella-maris TaxID=1810926 RepID=UPI003CCD2D4B
MSVTIGSLYGDDQHILEDLQLLPRWEEPEPSGTLVERLAATPALVTSASTSSNVLSPSEVSTPGLTRRYRQGTMDGIPWFEEMIEGSGLGKLIKRRRGAGTSDDNSTTIEWEVSEWTSTGPEAEGSAAQAMGKRKGDEFTGVDGS